VHISNLKRKGLVLSMNIGLKTIRKEGGMPPKIYRVLRVRKTTGSQRTGNFVCLFGEGGNQNGRQGCSQEEGLKPRTGR